MQQDEEVKQKYEIAELEGLEFISTTSDNSGSPKDVIGAIIGFKTFKEAETLVNKYPENKFDVITLNRKDGWDLWFRGGKTYREFENSADDFGDNYSEIIKMSENDFIEAEIYPFFPLFELMYEGKKIADLIQAVADAKNQFYMDESGFIEETDAVEALTGQFDLEEFDLVNAFLQMKNEIFDELKKLDPNQVVITFQGKYYETLDKKSMSFYHDTNHYAIGVV